MTRLTRTSPLARERRESLTVRRFTVATSLSPSLRWTFSASYPVTGFPETEPEITARPGKLVTAASMDFLKSDVPTSWPDRKK